MRIGVISDTHGMLRPEVVEILRGCDVILHAGDIDNQLIISQLEKIAKLHVVCGNMDGGMSRILPRTLTVNLCGKNFYIIHNVDMAGEGILDADFVIYGHTHEYAELKSDGRQFLNPGSCGKERYGLPPTMAVMELDDTGEYSITKIDLTKYAVERQEKPVSEAELSHTIDVVIREVNRGKSVEHIAEKHNIPFNLADRICRMYLTHPGIDKDGIINRL